MTDLFDNDCSPRAQPREGAGRAARRYYGKYAGIVVTNGPPDSGDHRGQLTVRVPGILEEKPGSDQSQPIEVIAAPSFLPGFFFIPEVNDNVWVEFVAGDINFPIWTGVWYPRDRPPKDADGGAPTEQTKVIRTISGQVIQLDDTADSERIVLRDAKNDNTITLDKAGIKLEGKPSDGSIMLVFGRGTVTITDSGVEVVHGDNKVTLTDSGVEVARGANKVTLTDSSVEIKGPASTLSMDGSGAKLADQHVVLEPLITWLMTHMHLGNMGAPTPLDPGSMTALNNQLTAGLLTSKALPGV
jgi:uncharacterized protein involved in type VI secretion and phage assembly